MLVVTLSNDVSVERIVLNIREKSVAKPDIYDVKAYFNVTIIACAFLNSFTAQLPHASLPSSLGPAVPLALRSAFQPLVPPPTASSMSAEVIKPF